MPDSVADPFVPLNVVVTCQRGEAELAKAQLASLADVRLKGTGYRDVLAGHAPDAERLVAGLERLSQSASGAGNNPSFIPSFHRVVLLETVFDYTPATLVGEIASRLDAFLPRISEGSSFAVRFQRRGFDGVVHSQETERAVADAVFSRLAQLGVKARVDLKDPDCVLQIETLGTKAGLGWLSKARRLRSDFLRLK